MYLLFALEYLVGIILTPPQMPFSYINNVSGSFNNSSYILLSFKQASQANPRAV